MKKFTCIWCGLVTPINKIISFRNDVFCPHCHNTDPYHLTMADYVQIFKNNKKGVGNHDWYY